MTRPRRWTGWVLGAAGAAALAGGAEAAQRNQDRLLAEIRQIQAQLATLAETQATLGEAIGTFLEDRASERADARRSRADVENALERLEREVARLSTSLGQTNERFAHLAAEVESLREAQRTALLAGVSPVDGSGEEETAPASADSGEDEGSAGGQATEVAVLDGPSITEIYMQAQSDYLAGRYELAISGFEQVVEDGSELADDARYFMGDALLAQDRLEPALDQFVTLIRDLPDSLRIGDAWFKRGVILRRLGHESDAREIFEDILNVYAGTPAALAAQRELEAMGPGEPGH